MHERVNWRIESKNVAVTAALVVATVAFYKATELALEALGSTTTGWLWPAVMFVMVGEYAYMESRSAERQGRPRTSRTLILCAAVLGGVGLVLTVLASW